MYLRSIHAESHIPTLRQFIKDNPLGKFTTGIPSAEYPFLQASQIPWILDVNDDSSYIDLGVLRGHIARQNPQAKAIIDSLTPGISGTSSSKTATTGGMKLANEVLVLFTAPVHHYVTPKFYAETKPATGKVVPTWNYAAVQAYGNATVYFDGSDESTSFLTRQISDLSRHAETSVMGYTGEKGEKGPWKVEDAPDRYIAILQKNIIGVEVEITRLGGKFKMSQEMGEGDRAGVVAGFEGLGTEAGMRIARMVGEREELIQRAKG